MPSGTLRPLAMRDLDALLALWRDPPVNAALHRGARVERERAQAWLERAVQDPPRVFAVLDEGEMVGYAGIQPLAETGEPEILYALLARVWGRGLATRAGEAVLAHARDALGLRHVIALVHPENPRSARVVEKLRFREVGTMEHAGMPHRRFERALTSS